MLLTPGMLMGVGSVWLERIPRKLMAAARDERDGNERRAAGISTSVGGSGRGHRSSTGRLHRRSVASRLHSIAHHAFGFSN